MLYTWGQNELRLRASAPHFNKNTCYYSSWEEGEEERDRMWEQEEERKKRVKRAVELWEKRNWEQVFLRMSGEGSRRVHTPHGGYIRARKRNNDAVSLWY